MSNKVKILKKELLYDDFFKLEKQSISFLKFNGQFSAPIERATWVVGRASSAIVYDKSNKDIILVKQFRLPTMGMNNEDGWLLEIVAGISENKEDEFQTIEREMKEEIGFKPEKLIKIADVHMAPGSVKEFLSIFYAEVSNDTQVSKGGGVDVGEDIKIIRYKYEDLINLLIEGKITDAKTFIALQWLSINKDYIQKN